MKFQASYHQKLLFNQSWNVSCESDGATFATSKRPLFSLSKKHKKEKRRRRKEVKSLSHLNSLKSFLFLLSKKK